MPKYILAVVCVTCLGCATLTVVDEPFTFRGPAPLDTRLRLDGYYYFTPLESYRISIEETALQPAIWPLLLWNDGTAALMHSMGGAPTSRPDGDQTAYYNLIISRQKDRFERYLRGEEDLSWSEGLGLFDEDRSGFRDWLKWGAFRARGDSLILQILEPRQGAWPGQSFDVVEYRGRALSDTSFVLEEAHLLSGDTRRLHWFSEYTQLRGPVVYYFKPFEGKPSSENWTHTHPDLQ